jgi:hypothetical protein
VGRQPPCPDTSRVFLPPAPRSLPRQHMCTGLARCLVLRGCRAVFCPGRKCRTRDPPASGGEPRQHYAVLRQVSVCARAHADAGGGGAVVCATWGCVPPSALLSSTVTSLAVVAFLALAVCSAWGPRVVRSLGRIPCAPGTSTQSGPEPSLMKSYTRNSAHTHSPATVLVVSPHASTAAVCCA